MFHLHEILGVRGSSADKYTKNIGSQLCVHAVFRRGGNSSGFMVPNERRTVRGAPDSVRSAGVIPQPLRTCLCRRRRRGKPSLQGISSNFAFRGDASVGIAHCGVVYPLTNGATVLFHFFWFLMRCLLFFVFTGRSGLGCKYKIIFRKYAIPGVFCRLFGRIPILLRLLFLFVVFRRAVASGGA